MTAARTLATAWDEALLDLPIDIDAETLALVRRHFYRGALATLGMPAEQLRAETRGARPRDRQPGRARVDPCRPCARARGCAGAPDAPQRLNGARLSRGTSARANGWAAGGGTRR